MVGELKEDERKVKRGSEQDNVKKGWKKKDETRMR